MVSATPLPIELRCELGEGPVWDAERGVALVVDIDPGTLWQLTLGSASVATELLRCGTTLGAAAPAVGGGFLLAAGKVLRHVDEGGLTVREFPLVPDSVASRLNDGATDPAGRYLVGSLAQDGRRGEERLWRLEPDGTATALDDDLTLSNGLGWSPDGTILYSVDSVPGTIWFRDYDAGSDRIGSRRRLLDIVDGTPDGMTVDSEGTLWVAIWGRGEVRAYTPTGQQVDVIAVGAPHTTSCAFVGPDLRTLLITTAGKPVDGTAPTSLCGGLFMIELPVSGQPTTAWSPAG